MRFLLLILLSFPVFAQLQLRHHSPEARTAVVVVHGINPTHAHFDSLIERLAETGASVWYFRYNDGEHLDTSSAKLASALGASERGGS